MEPDSALGLEPDQKVPRNLVNEQKVPESQICGSDEYDLPLDLRCIRGTEGQELLDSDSEGSDDTRKSSPTGFPECGDCPDRFCFRFDGKN